MIASPDKPKLRWWRFSRRWLRLSLRTFLILLTVACLWLGWFVNRANQQRRAVQWVEEIGGRVDYDFELNKDYWTDKYAGPPGPDWLSNLIGIDYFATVLQVDLNNRPVDDVTPLANLTNLEYLILDNTQISDVTELANLTTLKWLWLDGTQVSDVTPLRNLTNLTELTLSNTPISDVTPLTNLAKLEVLDLGSTQVSDVTPLAGLTKLKALSIQGTQVSEEDIEMLQKSLPLLEIYKKDES